MHIMGICICTFEKMTTCLLLSLSRTRALSRFARFLLAQLNFCVCFVFVCVCVCVCVCAMYLFVYAGSSAESG